jgi:hypothetical protein
VYLTRVDPAELKSISHDVFPGQNVHQTLEWVEFISQTRHAEPVIAAIREGEESLGWFIGLLVKKFGFKILGSPFPGWSTTFMGFCLKPGVSREVALRALDRFCFSELKCRHLELLDRDLDASVAANLGYTIWNFETFEIDLTRSEDEIFHAMKHQCRNCIRKAAKSGIRIEEAVDDEFADDFHAQLTHVYEVKGLPVPYDVDRVKTLIELLAPTGRLLLLRARNEDGVCVATGIFTGMNTTAFAWGSASYRHYSESRPNEAIFWHAMRYWRAKGIRVFDLTGAAEYKKKYGGELVVTPWIRKSSNRVVGFLRTAAEELMLKYPNVFTRFYGG